MLWIWLIGLLRVRRGRLLGAATGVAAAVAMLAVLAGFLAASKATMTRQAVRTAAMDWQVLVQPGADATAVLDTIRAQPGTSAALPVGYATTSGLEATTAGSTQNTGPGIVLGLPPAYPATFPAELRPLAGGTTGVLLAQQTAANLHAAPGDTISIGRAGLPPVQIRVDGVVDLPYADSLFQKIGAPPQAQPVAPPDNVVLLPESSWHAAFDPLAASRPDLVTIQVHAARSHILPADPAAAYTLVTGQARNAEARMAGAGVVGDNLGAVLDAARSDALYAQLLFLFLGAPGALLAGVLTTAIAGAGAARRRREQALLRTRGATAAQLLRLAAVEAVVVAVIGGVGGLCAATLVGRFALGSAGFGTTPASAVGWALGAITAGILIACAAVLLPVWRELRTATVISERALLGRRRAPWWARRGLAAALLAGAAAVFAVTGRRNYALVLAPEGTPKLSVNYWAFAGPALLWAGSALLAWQLTELLLTRGRPLLSRALRPLSGPLAGTVAASLFRQRGIVVRSVVLVALAVAFAASTATFNTTYRQQAEVDAVLTNGADVTVTESPGSVIGPSEAARLAAVPGVHHVEPLQHRFAYVGADLQDLYGVRPATIVAAGRLQDASYFAGGTARQLMDRLARQPDAILVSAETAQDFQLQPGDLLRLRLQDGRTGQLRTIPFHFAGVVKEFPTAPKDSFLVANASYITQATGSDAVGAFLLDTGSTSSAAVAGRLRGLLGPSARVTDLATTRAVVATSLTAVDLRGLTRVELAFALVLAAAAGGLVFALGLAERRRTLALAAMLGARGRQLAGFVWSEAALVATVGLAAGAVIGWALSHMLVKVLAGVFDPPPEHPAVPWIYLTGLTVLTLASLAAAATATVRHARRPALSELRDL